MKAISTHLLSWSHSTIITQLTQASQLASHGCDSETLFSTSHCPLPLRFLCPRAEPEVPQVRHPGPGLGPPGVPRVQPLLPVQAGKATLMGGECAPNAGQGPGQGPVLGQHGGQEICRADCLRPADHAEPHVYCEGQDRYSGSDAALGHGYQQWCRLGALLRLCRLLIHSLCLWEVHLLQDPWLRGTPVQAGIACCLSLH